MLRERIDSSSSRAPLSTLFIALGRVFSLLILVLVDTILAEDGGDAGAAAGVRGGSGPVIQVFGLIARKAAAIVPVLRAAVAAATAAPAAAPGGGGGISPLLFTDSLRATAARLALREWTDKKPAEAQLAAFTSPFGLALGMLNCPVRAPAAGAVTRPPPCCSFIACFFFALSSDDSSERLTTSAPESPCLGVASSD